MVFCAPICGIIGNMIGLKWVLVFGTLGYVPYSAALYCNSVFGTQWFLLFGAATCGFSVCTYPSYDTGVFTDISRLPLCGQPKLLLQ
jgi:hypothetical protein